MVQQATTTKGFVVMGQTKKSGTYQLSCGHEIKKTLDPERRVRCPNCASDAIVIRVMK